MTSQAGKRKEPSHRQHILRNFNILPPPKGVDDGVPNESPVGCVAPETMSYKTMQNGF